MVGKASDGEMWLVYSFVLFGWDTSGQVGGVVVRFLL